MIATRRLAVAALLLTLSACGGDDTPIENQTTASAEGVAEIERFAAAQRAAGRVTAIDAATGDASGMPAPQTGPDAFALDQRAEARAQREESEAKASDGRRADGAAGDRPPAEVEVLPSVAD